MHFVSCFPSRLNLWQKMLHCVVQNHCQSNRDLAYQLILHS